MKWVLSVALSIAAVSIMVLPRASAATDLLATQPPDVRMYYAKIDAIVRSRGWACVYIDGPHAYAYAYSVGLSGRHAPELIVFIPTLSHQAMCGLINEVARRILASGRMPRDHDYPLGNDRVRLNRIYTHEFFDKCDMAELWRDMHGIRDALGMQVVLKDPDGTYPSGD